MEVDTNNLVIEHNEAQRRFEIQLGEYLAELDYVMRGNVITYTHTGTPKPLEGHGIGSRLVKHGLDYARENGLRVVPQCPFVGTYIEQHPEYRDLLA